MKTLMKCTEMLYTFWTYRMSTAKFIRNAKIRRLSNPPIGGTDDLQFFKISDCHHIFYLWNIFSLTCRASILDHHRNVKISGISVLLILNFWWPTTYPTTSHLPVEPFWCLVDPPILCTRRGEMFYADRLWSHNPLCTQVYNISSHQGKPGTRLVVQ